MLPEQTRPTDQPTNKVQTFVNAWDKSQGEVLPYRRDPTIERMYAIYMENVSDINRLKVLLGDITRAVQVIY